MFEIDIAIEINFDIWNWKENHAQTRYPINFSNIDRFLKTGTFLLDEDLRALRKWQTSKIRNLGQLWPYKSLQSHLFQHREVKSLPVAARRWSHCQFDELKMEKRLFVRSMRQVEYEWCWRKWQVQRFKLHSKFLISIRGDDLLCSPNCGRLVVRPHFQCDTSVQWCKLKFRQTNGDIQLRNGIFRLTRVDLDNDHSKEQHQ